MGHHVEYALCGEGWVGDHLGSCAGSHGGDDGEQEGEEVGGMR